jgi:hypothetical protein
VPPGHPENLLSRCQPTASQPSSHKAPLLEPWRLRQLYQSIALAAADRRDEPVGDAFFNAALRRANRRAVIALFVLFTRRIYFCGGIRSDGSKYAASAAARRVPRLQSIGHLRSNADGVVH